MNECTLQSTFISFWIEPPLLFCVLLDPCVWALGRGVPGFRGGLRPCFAVYCLVIRDSSPFSPAKGFAPIKRTCTALSTIFKNVPNLLSGSPWPKGSRSKKIDCSSSCSALKLFSSCADKPLGFGCFRLGFLQLLILLFADGRLILRFNSRSCFCFAFSSRSGLCFSAIWYLLRPRLCQPRSHGSSWHSFPRLVCLTDWFPPEVDRPHLLFFNFKVTRTQEPLEWILLVADTSLVLIGLMIVLQTPPSALWLICFTMQNGIIGFA